MALSKYVITAAVTVPAGTASTPTAGEPATGGAAGFGNAAISAGVSLYPQILVSGQAIVLDSGSALYAYLNGQGVLRLFTDGQDNVGHGALSN